MPYYPTPSERMTRRAALVGAIAVTVAASFAIGVTLQRIEADMAREDGCSAKADPIACMIVLDDLDPPYSRLAAEASSNG